MAKHYYVSENVNEGTFEDWETIVDSTFEMNFDADYMEKDGVPIVSDGHLARGYSLEQPMMVVAATGSGKTRRLIIQFLISCILSACSMLINDPKGELYKHTKKMLEKLGYKVSNSFNTKAFRNDILSGDDDSKEDKGDPISFYRFDVRA